MSLTINEIVTKVREITYDRFPTPVIYIKRTNSDNWRVSTTSPNFVIADYTDVNDPITKLTVPFEDGTFGGLFEALLGDMELYSIATTFAFKESDPLSILLPSAKSMAQPITIFKKVFYSEERILELINAYFIRYREISCTCVNTENITALLEKLACGNENHLIWWISFYLIEDRRIAEAAQSSINIAFTNDSDAFDGIQELSISRLDYNTTVKVADVFSLADKKDDPFQSIDISKAGTENLWGDNGFWWRYQNQLRTQIERTYGDYSLRLNQVIQSQMILQKDYSYNEYYPQYPYTYFNAKFEAEKNKGCQ